MEQQNTKYWLWLVMVFGVSNEKTLELYRMHDSLKELYYVLHDPDCSLLTEKERRNVRQIKLEQCESVMEYCEKNGIGIMTWDSALYPDALRHIYNPPALLFYKGNLTLLRESMLLTVVGTRRPSAYSMKVSQWLCHDLAKCNIVLVSGCAVGLDASAHSAAIEEGKPTIAVLGCGVDYDYPKENRALKEKIVQNGLLLSEYFPGTSPMPFHFPVRNRILSGISEGVLVLEASARSGALITANLACEQGKQVFCVPPADLFDPRYSGVVNFLRDGAYPVFNYLDVLYTFYLHYPHKLTLFDEDDACRTEDSLIYAENSRAAAPRSKRPKIKAHSAQEETLEQEKPEIRQMEYSPQQQKVIALLQNGGQNINSICCQLGISFEETSILMMELEMMGCVTNAERDIFMLAE